MNGYLSEKAFSNYWLFEKVIQLVPFFPSQVLCKISPSSAYPIPYLKQSLNLLPRFSILDYYFITKINFRFSLGWSFAKLAWIQIYEYLFYCVQNSNPSFHSPFTFAAALPISPPWPSAYFKISSFAASRQFFWSVVPRNGAIHEPNPAI